MRIAVASQNRVTVTSHAGRCRRFWIYDVQDGAIIRRVLIELEREETLHASHDAPHPIYRTDVLITGGLGAGLVNRLARHGVTAVATSEEDPDRAVRKFLLGTLERLPAESHAHAET